MARVGRSDAGKMALPTEVTCKGVGRHRGREEREEAEGPGSLFSLTLETASILFMFKLEFCVSVCMYMCMWAYMWGGRVRGKPQVLFLRHHLSCFLKQGLSSTQASPTGQPSGPTCLLLSSTEDHQDALPKLSTQICFALAQRVDLKSS